jgi:hypothetical protein
MAITWDTGFLKWAFWQNQHLWLQKVLVSIWAIMGSTSQHFLKVLQG